MNAKTPDLPDLVYSYRLTYFGGTAPCDDNDRLTLAIRKRDMRRVMGREFRKRHGEKGKEPKRENLWFIGLMGKALKGQMDKALKKQGKKADDREGGDILIYRKAH